MVKPIDAVITWQRYPPIHPNVDDPSGKDRLAGIAAGTGVGLSLASEQGDPRHREADEQRDNQTVPHKRRGILHSGATVPPWTSRS